MKHPNGYVLPKNVLHRFRNSEHNFCQACKRKFQLGDIVISLGKGRHYHKKCFDDLFVGDDD